MKQRSKPIVTIGASSLLLIFLSLCLLTFAVLSLSSSRADLRLSEKLVDRTKAYYAAESRASDLLSALDEELVVHYHNTSNEEQYFSGLKTALSINNGQFHLEKDLLSFSVPIQEGQQLFVLLRLVYPNDAVTPFYTIQTWKVEHTEEWTPDTSQNLYIQPEKENKHE